MSEAMKLLEIFGPWAIVVFLGIAYYRKDKQYAEVMQNMIKVIESKTVADTKLETALNGLRDVIMLCRNVKGS